MAARSSASRCASAALALKPFQPLLAASDLEARVSNDVHNTMIAIGQSIDPDGLVAFWPRARGNVSLTAWAYSFLVAARQAGEPVDKALMDRLAAVLKLSLRSDYSRLIAGEELRERVEALTALAAGGKLDEGYAAELARRADQMPNASVAQMASVAARMPGDDRRIVDALVQDMWSRVKFLSRNGKQVYAGQAADDGDAEILPSEAKSLAEMTEAAALAAPDDPRAGVLRDGADPARRRRWLGQHQREFRRRARAGAPSGNARRRKRRSRVTQGAAVDRLALSADAPVARAALSGARRRAHRQQWRSARSSRSLMRHTCPTSPAIAPRRASQGFVVTRTSYRVPQGDAPPERIAPADDGALHLKTGDVVEEMVELVNPQDRVHVAISLPLAAGLDPLNPNLANAPARSLRPPSRRRLSRHGRSFDDDRVFYAYDALPKGNYRFAFRAKALVAGAFTQPPGEAETMYQAGHSWRERRATHHHCEVEPAVGSSPEPSPRLALPLSRRRSRATSTRARI